MLPTALPSLKNQLRWEPHVSYVKNDNNKQIDIIIFLASSERNAHEERHLFIISLLPLIPNTGKQSSFFLLSTLIPQVTAPLCLTPAMSQCILGNWKQVSGGSETFECSSHLPSIPGDWRTWRGNISLILFHLLASECTRGGVGGWFRLDVCVEARLRGGECNLEGIEKNTSTAHYSGRRFYFMLPVKFFVEFLFLWGGRIG